MKVVTKHIDLSTYFNSQISNRASIDSIFSNNVCGDYVFSIDFKNINFLSRAAAHELITWLNVLSDRGVELTLMNLSLPVKDMLDAVKESRKFNVKKATFVEHLSFDTENELDDFLLSV
jgi:anti-anti-sigma regulatory factor